MSSRFLAFALAASVLSPGLPALAQTAPTAQLEQRTAQLENRLRGKTGAFERQQLQRQQSEIDALIRRLEAGENVSADEIDRLLGNTPLRINLSR